MAELKYTIAMMEIVNEILKAALGEAPDWRQLQTKAEELKTLAQYAQVTTDLGANEYPGDGHGRRT